MKKFLSAENYYHPELYAMWKLAARHNRGSKLPDSVIRAVRNNIKRLLGNGNC